MLLNNNKGFNLIGIMIAAAIGLVVVIGITRSLMHFSSQSQKTSSKQIISSVKNNVYSLLKNRKAWRWATAVRQNSCLPGKNNCPIILWHNPTNPSTATAYNDSTTVRVWACNIGKRGGAIAYFTHSGAPLELGSSASVCSRCSKAKDESHCHLKRLKKDPSKFVRVKIAPLKGYNPSSKTTPPFNFSVEDYSLTKAKTSFKSQDGQLIFSPSTSSCPPGQFMTGYLNDDGTPACAALGFTGVSCRAGMVVVRINPDGTAVCAIAPVSNTTNNVNLNGGACPAGQVAVRIAPNGSLACVIAVKINTRCPAGTFVYGIDAQGNILCTAP
jgi:hypothetical protein